MNRPSKFYFLCLQNEHICSAVLDEDHLFVWTELVCCLFTVTMCLRKQLKERNLYFILLCQSMVVWLHCCGLKVKLHIMEDMHGRRLLLTSWWQEYRESRRGKVQAQFSIFKNFFSHVLHANHFLLLTLSPEAPNSFCSRFTVHLFPLKQTNKQMNKQKT